MNMHSKHLKSRRLYALSCIAFVIVIALSLYLPALAAQADAVLVGSVTELSSRWLAVGFWTGKGLLDHNVAPALIGAVYGLNRLGRVFFGFVFHKTVTFAPLAEFIFNNICRDHFAYRRKNPHQLVVSHGVWDISHKNFLSHFQTFSTPLYHKIKKP